MRKIRAGREMDKRKNRNVAISAIARKPVTIAYLMLKNKEHFRYAVAERVHGKFTYLRTVTTGGPTKPVKAKHTTLPAVCAGRHLPPIRTFTNLPTGERKMLKEQQIEGVLGDLHKVKLRRA